MSLEQIDLRGDTDGSQNATITSKAVLGRLVSVEWVDGDLVDGVDAVLSVINRQSGVTRTLLTLTNANADAFYSPRDVVHDNAGAAVTFDGTNELYEPFLVDGVLQCAITSGGATKTGGMIVTIER